jgi:DNA-binding transcriptional MerR regulator
MTEEDDDTQQYVAQRKWVGLTVEEIKEMLYGLLEDDRTPMLTLIDAVQEKLKEKNT